MKACLKNTLGTDTNKHINKTLQKQYKSACISCFLWAWEYHSKENIQSVELCNIYNYWQISFYWLFRYRDKKISELRLGCTLKTKHKGMDYDNLLGIVIPDILLNILYCHGF